MYSTFKFTFCSADYEKRIKEEEESVEEIDRKVKEMQKLVAKQRKDMGGYVSILIVKL